MFGDGGTQGDAVDVRICSTLGDADAARRATRFREETGTLGDAVDVRRCGTQGDAVS
ncbi:MAG: hypothetical protein JF887_08115 [Candidatus Dormibacteraeota bacterium]|uniref:Uncharacterized protein n=1 Tax=Candidatus Amunia macphersoniae TaxID=3127014 RepID=A0A934N9T4_9BACT|nr:hypothetical protein [Candidatus Dormibacteraeota bacterium]